MNLDQWIETVRGIYVSQGKLLSGENEVILRSKIPVPESLEAHEALYKKQVPESPKCGDIMFYTSMVKGGVIGLEPNIPMQYKKEFEAVGEAITHDFFDRLCRGSVFGVEERIPVEHKALIQQYSESHQEFINLLRVFDTYAAEVDDLFPESFDTVLAQALADVRVSLKGLFFPMDGPYHIDMNTRIAAQENMLKTYAPTFDREAFFKNNPVLNQLRNQEAKWPGYVTIIAVLIGAAFVPQDRVWGKVVFWVLMGILVLAISSVSPFVRRLLFRK